MKMEPKIRAQFTLLGFLVLLAFVLSSCVDVPSEAPPLPKFKAKLRVIHAATDLGEVTVKLDGEVLASLNMEGASPYVDLDAGKHAFQVGNEEVDSLFVDTDFVGTFYIATLTNDNDSRFIKKRERWLYNAPAPEDTTIVTFAQFCPDGVFKIAMMGVNSAEQDTVRKTLASALAFTKFTWARLAVTGWDYTFYVIDGSDTLLTVKPTLASGTSVTEVLLNTKANLKVKEFMNE
jgi:hypothetical protein